MDISEINKSRSPRLALGPLFYYWSRDQILEFYAEMAESELHTVYLGEVVCSRRHEMRLSDWISIGKDLKAAGKEVVLSTPVLIESQSDLKAMCRIAENGEFEVEVNDMGALRRSVGQIPFIAGPHLNLYNAASIDIVTMLGARRWVMPIEYSKEALAELLPQLKNPIETEVFVFGRLPLAYSARCFTARYHNLSKDKCEFRCIHDPDGLLLQTREDQPFLVVNGTQTQSARTYCLIDQIESMKECGVTTLRISPQSRHMRNIIRAFDDCSRGKVESSYGRALIEKWIPVSSCDGYWHGRPGMEAWRPEEEEWQ
ncbi:MAG TPA: U32 family peptidase [Burkholderiales bacterium]|nr:U32 family peptidase [Burkholderiales bacterium]